MPKYIEPGTYIGEIETGPGPIEGASTGITAFIGRASRGPVLQPTPVASPAEFRSIFGEPIISPMTYLGYAADAFFLNGGTKAYIVRIVSDDAPQVPAGTPSRGGSVEDNLNRPADVKKGLGALKGYEGISLVAAPGADSKDDQQALIDHCEETRYCFAILDSAKNADIDAVIRQRRELDSQKGFAAMYYPWISMANPLTKNTVILPPSGAIAGIYARTAAERGVHKAPANEAISGATGLFCTVTQVEQERLNMEGINTIRSFPGRGIRVWGARTISSDPLWKYVNIRLLFNYIEESVDRGTRWAIFEPCDEKLWARLVQSVSEFLTRVWEDGALMGRKPEEAFFVRCDRSTMTQNDIDSGRLVISIGLAPTKPAEFVVFRIAQHADGGAK
jgi:hypothetical protein